MQSWADLCQPSSVPFCPTKRCTQFGFTTFQRSQCRWAAELLVAPVTWLMHSHELLHTYLRVRMAWACFFSDAKEKKIHKLFSLLKCLTGRFWAVLIWLIPMGLSSDNYTTKICPVWSILCRLGISIGRRLLVLYLNSLLCCSWMPQALNLLSHISLPFPTFLLSICCDFFPLPCPLVKSCSCRAAAAGADVKRFSNTR